MRIRLLQTVPLDIKHGMTEGRMLDVIEKIPPPEHKERGLNSAKYVVMGDAGEECRIYDYECEEI